LSSSSGPSGGAMNIQDNFGKNQAKFGPFVGDQDHRRDTSYRRPSDSWGYEDSQKMDTREDVYESRRRRFGNNNASNENYDRSRSRDFDNRRSRRSEGRHDHDDRRGRFSPYTSQNRQERRPRSEKTTTLLVTEIPQSSCNAETVYWYFKKFGEPQKVLVFPHKRQAIIQFANEQIASSACCSPEAAFGNRFVRIYYTSPDKVTEVDGAELYAPLPELTAEERQKKVEEAQQIQKQLQEKRQALLQKQEEERKALMAQIAHMNEEDRAKILRSLNVVSQAIISASASEGNFKKTVEMTASNAENGVDDKNSEMKGEVRICLY
jgi:glycerol-3-phosphate cytidylyltransferase-like family protein